MAALAAAVWCTYSFSIFLWVICVSGKETTTTIDYNTLSEDDRSFKLNPTNPSVFTTASVSSTEEPAVPLPVSGTIPAPQTDVGRWCPCDEDLEVCDVNCCCDKRCADEVPLFTSCSFSSVSGSKQLCNRDVASYILRTTADGHSKLISSVQKETSNDIFCIETQNRVDGLSHPTPIVPTQRNFNELFKRFSSFFWGSAGVAVKLPDDVQASPGYKFGDVMRTLGGVGEMFYLPAAVVTADCVDRSPAAFLKDQRSLCVRRVVLNQDCGSLPGLSIYTYADIQLISGKNMDLKVVPVEVDSVILQSVEGTQTKLNLSGGEDLRPRLLSPNLCANVVLKVVYVINYNSYGQVRNATVSLVLGFIREASVTLQQEFQLTFIKDGGDVAVQYSGRPGYVVGMPLVSGFLTPQGISRSLDLRNTMTVLNSSPDQDCLKSPLQHSPVLFGLDSVSGCTLRLKDILNCSLVYHLLLDVLKGTDYPYFVASFGNSSVEHSQDWVPIESLIHTTEGSSCNIPVSRHLEVKWTRYGSLLNPQAQIVSIRQVIHTNTSSLTVMSNQGIVRVSSSVAFLSVSAPARPGYRAMPTIQAKLPYDFFFPFV